MGQLAPCGDQGAMNAVSVRIEDADGEVRRAAVQALVILSNQKDSHVIVGLLNRMDAEIRLASVQALIKLDCGDVRSDVFAALHDCLGDAVVEMRVAAAQALANVY